MKRLLFFREDLTEQEMAINYREAIFALIIALCCVQSVWSHARLMEPPSRSSMWRHGFETPKNYDDDGLYCGGMQTQWKINGGKCGVCGDPWHLPVPRPNEMGGRYGNGIIVRSYKPGQVIQTVVDITANHRGFFEFRICANRNRKKEVTQECLDQNVLTILNRTSTRYHDVGTHGSSRVYLALQLPKGFTCKHCVFQWTYVAGNNWGRCKNGSFYLGCGAQETFKSCADIAIGEKTSTDTRPINSKPTNTVHQTDKDHKDEDKGEKDKKDKDKKEKDAKEKDKKEKDRRKKLPVLRPNAVRGETLQEALDRILKDPRLRWMLQPKKTD